MEENRCAGRAGQMVCGSFGLKSRSRRQHRLSDQILLSALDKGGDCQYF